MSYTPVLIQAGCQSQTAIKVIKRCKKCYGLYKDGGVMRKVLVIIDMQNDFIDGALGNKECREVVPAVIDSVNNGEYTDIILTRDTHDEDYLNTQEGKRLPVVHCIKGTRGWQINEDILKTVEVFYQKKGQNMNRDCECKK